MARQVLILTPEDMVKVQAGRFKPPAGIRLADLQALLDQLINDIQAQHGPDSGIVQLSLHADNSVEVVVAGDGWEAA